MSSPPPRITIIIPAHNAADTLDTALRSVTYQTMPDWEAIVIDDGSTDGTAEVVQRWMGEGQRIRLIRQPQGGVSRARNAGLEAAETEWALFLDADDWIAPEHLERMFAALDGAPGADVACCGYRRVTPAGELLPAELAPQVEYRAFQAFARHCVVAIHCVVFRRALALAVGGFDPGLPVGEDWDLWLRIARTGARFVAVPEVLAFYRMRGESLSWDMLTMARYCQEVMARARRPDPRVPDPDPRFAEGIEEEGLDGARTFVLLWCVAAGAAAGQDVGGRLGPVDGLTDVKDMLPDIHSLLRGALMIGAQIAEDRIDAAWRRALPLVIPFLERLEAASTQPGLARRLAYTFERALLRASRLESPMIFSTALGMIIDVGRFAPIVPPPGVDMLHLRFHAGDELLAICELPAWGAQTAADVAGIAIDTLGFDTVLKRGGYDEPTLIHAARRARRRPETGSDARKTAVIAETWDEIFAQATSASPAHAAMIGQAAIATPGTDARRPILWGGIRRRSKPMTAGATRDVPVLMYHRIASDGADALAPYRLSPADFDAQLRLLRRHGFHGVTSPQIAWHRAQGRPIEGRPVMLSFDDAYRDFRETAWPILQRHGFRAEVFVVTDKVGGVADWDAEYGPPAPLMSWREIAEAQTGGIVFGSHLATHRMAESLTSEELLREAARSRATLQARLGDPCISFAAPYGSSDERLVRILHEVGYRMGFTTCHGIASFSDHALSLPRIEVRGDWTLADFAAALGLPSPSWRNRAP